MVLSNQSGPTGPSYPPTSMVEIIETGMTEDDDDNDDGMNDYEELLAYLDEDEFFYAWYYVIELENMWIFH